MEGKEKIFLALKYFHDKNYRLKDFCDNIYLIYRDECDYDLIDGNASLNQQICEFAYKCGFVSDDIAQIIEDPLWLVDPIQIRIEAEALYQDLNIADLKELSFSK
ncbi:MAG TPA: hypothetical protein PLQ36_02110 [Candidatus Gracilibacteria bacterium]|nr:hypothetical protein [Candidatus Gracilibacteria bacterium]